MDDEQLDEEQEGDEEGGGGSEPKLHAPIIVLGFITFIICDLLSLIPFVADILDAGFAIVVILLAISGIGGTLVLGINFLALVVKFIPVLQALPFYTIAWIVAVAADHSQKVKTVVATTAAVGGVAEGVRGVAGAGEATAVAEGSAAAAEAGTTTASVEAEIATGSGTGEIPGVGPSETGTGKPSEAGTKPSETSTERKPEARRPSESPSTSQEQAGAPEEGAPKKPEISGEALGERPTEFEEMEKMFKETPKELEWQPKPGEETQKSQAPKSRIEKVNKSVQDTLDRHGIQGERAGIDITEENEDTKKVA